MLASNFSTLLLIMSYINLSSKFFLIASYIVYIYIVLQVELI